MSGAPAIPICEPIGNAASAECFTMCTVGLAPPASRAEA